MDFSTILPTKIEFICTTQVLDKILCDKAGIKWDQQLADGLEEKVKHYFVVKTNMEYNVVSSHILDPFMKEHSIKVMIHQSDKAKKCIQHYLKALK
ncbi:hypothetical protein SAMN03003324_00849 [Pedobacter antarcticus]|nr:hypothetical protein SAMN03003324_00849 [Pedobacter antarcticus]